MGLLILGLCAAAAGVLAHWLLRGWYITASILAGFLSAVLFNIAHDIALGYPDKWILIAAPQEVLLSIAVAAFVGYAFWLRRR